MRSLIPAVAVACLALGAVAGAAVPDNLEERLAAIAGTFTALHERIAADEARLIALEEMVRKVRSRLVAELDQPMLLLVGRGPCPQNFKRIDTRVLILTRTRNAETGVLLDEAGLTYEDPPGVGNNVYRDFSLCYRPPKTGRIEE